jgi:hypothetical protein
MASRLQWQGLDRDTVLSEEELTRNLRLQRIFLPYSMKQREEAYARQGVAAASGEYLRFAHYTSADAALKILREKRIWMRNVTCMADYREVQHGFDILLRYFDQARTKEFSDSLDMCMPGAATEAINYFNGWWSNKLALNTYVTSLSEHDPTTDNLHGRLSMWRAFGTSAVTRVAIVAKIPFYFGGAEQLRIVFSPVAYLTEEESHAQIREVVGNVARETDFLRTMDRQTIVNYVFMMLFVGVACLKHDGFREEREWRAVYNQHIFPSTLMERSIEIVGGVPQPLYKLPMDETVSSSLAELDVRNLVDRIIIGPSQYPWVQYEAFVDALKRHNVPDAENRVWISGIPIRS